MKSKDLFWVRMFLSRVLVGFTIGLLSISISHAQNTDTEQDPKSRLVENVKNWVASEEGINDSYIEVQANDRRFIVPDCAAEFEVAFAFGSKSNVQVNCRSEDWQAVLRIQIREETETLVYARHLVQGDVISTEDLEINRGTSLLRNNGVANLSQAEGQLLQVDVEKGQMVSLNHFADTLTIFVTNQDLEQGQTLVASMLDPVITPSSETLFEQRFDLSTTANSIITRDLAAGTILTKEDFATSSPAIVVTRLVERGSMIDPSNSQEEAVTVRIPNDAVTNPIQLNRATAKRRLTPGTIIRFSDITLQPHVVAEESTTLQLRRPQFTLTMEALAMEDGYIGDRIRVRNQESGEIIYATVIDIGLVEVRQ